MGFGNCVRDAECKRMIPGEAGLHNLIIALDSWPRRALKASMASLGRSILASQHLRERDSPGIMRSHPASRISYPAVSLH